MPHTYDELRKMTLADLRSVAKELQHEDVQGYTQMNKEHLLPAVCRALGLEAHEHHAAGGEAKLATRARLHELRTLRAQAIEAHDHDRLKSIRREYHHLNHTLRDAARRGAHA